MRISFRIALAFLGVVFVVFAFQTSLSIRWHSTLYRIDVQRDLRVMGHLLAPAVTTLRREEGSVRVTVTQASAAGRPRAGSSSGVPSARGSR